MSLKSRIQFIMENEAVAPGTPNRPLSQLDQNLNYLWELIQASQLGTTVYARQRVIDNTLVVGTPVYFNKDTQRFEAAYVNVITDSVTGSLIVPEYAQVWGILAAKTATAVGDILLFGYADIDIASATDTGVVTAGNWYLSGLSTGKLSQTPSSLTIPVLKSDGAGGVFVNCSFNDFIGNHRHYSFDLTMLPAGIVTPPAVQEPHTFVSADADLPGWLPADHASFAGKAPAGAKFGYNLEQHTALKNAFPPIPLQSVVATMQRPSIWDTNDSRSYYGQQLMEDRLLVDRNGIWWMSDCYDEVPWPTDYDSTSSVSASYGDCDPGNKEYKLKLYFTRVNFATDNSSVTSLVSTDDRVVIHCAGTEDVKATGDLEISLDLSLMLGSNTATGYSVLKTFDPDTNEFTSGPIVEGVYKTSDNVLITSSESAVVDSKVVHKGILGIGVVSQATLELNSQLVRLDGVTEESYPVLYLGMPDTQTTSCVIKFEVPSDAPNNIELVLRLRLLGKAAGTTPQLAVDYYKTSRPTNGLLTPISVTQSYASVVIDTVATLTANQAVEANSDPIAVSKGDIVYFRITRTPSDVSDTYGGELGLMQQTAIITAQE